MKILGISGGMRNGSNDGMCIEALMGAKEMGAEVEFIQLQNLHIEHCTGCTACTAVCPRKVIQMKPIAPQPAVKCSSKDKGAVVNKTCKVGCIACGLCVRNCPNQAIFLKDNVAVIDYTKCNGCGTCVSKCPKKAIQWVEGTPRPIDAPVPAHEVLKTRV